MKGTGILVHGRHLQAEGWETLVWGEPPHKLGSLTMMVYMALNEGPENITLVVFGTGASEKDGFKEAEYMKQYLLEHFGDLVQFPRIADHPAFTEDGQARLEKVVERIVPEIQSKNTLEELKNAARLFTDAGVERIIQIACGSHLPRCIQNRLQVKEAGGIPEGPMWHAVADDMTYLGSSAGDVTILEPPHRGDDPLLREPKDRLPSELAKRIFRIPFPKRLELLDEWDALLKRYNV